MEYAEGPRGEVVCLAQEKGGRVKGAGRGKQCGDRVVSASVCERPLLPCPRGGGELRQMAPISSELAVSQLFVLFTQIYTLL